MILFFILLFFLFLSSSFSFSFFILLTHVRMSQSSAVPNFSFRRIFHLQNFSILRRNPFSANAATAIMMPKWKYVTPLILLFSYFFSYFLFFLLSFFLF